MDYSYQKENDANINDFLYSDNSQAALENKIGSNNGNNMGGSQKQARPPSASAAKMYFSSNKII